MSSVMYRPPFEADSFLLEVTEGCSHNRCTFCTMYRDVPYRMLETEAVENQLKKAQPYAARIERVFLEHGDPFSLSAGCLLAAADLVHRYLPQIRTIAMYVSDAFRSHELAYNQITVVRHPMYEAVKENRNRQISK